NYDFSSKYLAEFVFRYDGSQNFPSSRRYGFFPAASIGWRLSEEPFFHNAAPYVDQLKLRLSAGQTGNDKVNSYQYLQTYSFGNNYVFGSSDVSGIYANTMPNTRITWERSTKADFGLDATLWKGLLGVEFTMFKEWRSNILHARSVTYPNTLGFSSLPDENIAKVNNHGFELKISHRNKIGDLGYRLESNMSFAKSKIIYIDETPATEAYANATGHPLGAGLYYKSLGIFHTQAEIDAYPHQANTQVGDIKVADLNGDKKIDSNDQFRFDYTDTPQIVFGFNTNFQYKNFDLTLFFQGQTRAYHYDGQFANLGDNNNDNAFVAREEDHWTVDNPNGTMPRAGANAPGTTTFFLYDATFVRLKTAEFGYTLPKKIASIVGLSDLRIYASGFNLLTWAKSIKWEDPELSGDALYYPQQRVINVGVNVKF
ncbi:MAG: TonB-dependent receptor, partial [Bacteroidetes bacterium]|nr:TonB-dependent receptor [Bacteroidota bacterium]